jgi:hypothetical protein
MKLLISTIAFTILISLNSFAQLEKGYWIGSISGSLTTGKDSQFKTFTIILNPEAMLFVSSKLAVGGNFSYGLFSMNKYENGDGLETIKIRETYLEIGPEARYYFGNFHLKPFADLGMGLRMNRRWTDNSQYEAYSPKWDFYARPAAGIAWWINDKVSLNLSTSYTFLNFKEADFDGVKIGVSFLFGNAGLKN